MVSDISPNHPKQRLQFFVAQEIDDSIRALTRDFVLELRSSCDWMCGPPQFIDHIDEPEDVSKGDLPVETLGGYLEIYTGMPPWNLPHDVDLRHLHEVETLVQALLAFSVTLQLLIELELDNVFVGAIENGEMDESLTAGFLGEWQRHLDSAQ